MTTADEARKVDAEGFVLAVHKPNIIDNVLYANHDMACAVCHQRHAVYHCNGPKGGVFDPCIECQREGWTTHRKRGLTAWLLAVLANGGKGVGNV